jgi:hypothetical protein
MWDAIFDGIAGEAPATLGKNKGGPVLGGWNSAKPEENPINGRTYCVQVSHVHATFEAQGRACTRHLEGKCSHPASRVSLTVITLLDIWHDIFSHRASTHSSRLRRPDERGEASMIHAGSGSGR